MKKESLLSDSKIVGYGVLMGGANVIPGVSGGTVALILGIYQRVVTSLSHCDLALLILLRKGKWQDAAQRVDLRFLVGLTIGVLLGVFSLGYAMNVLLGNEVTRPYTLGAFFGMIIASAIVVFRTITWKSQAKMYLYLAVGVVGAAAAFGMTFLPRSEIEASPWYAFLCGMVCICTMILPGISGAYVLLFMGAYMHLTGIIKDMLHLEFTLEDLLTISAFAAGCVIGLIGFSKFLRWLLARHHSATMALLCGFMVGALRQIWPFQTKIDEHQYEYFMPTACDAQVLGVIAAAVIAIVLVLWMERGGIEPKEEL